MSDVQAKAAYVRAGMHVEPDEIMALMHKCHAKHCGVFIHPRQCMCSRHWAMVPRRLKNLVWKYYRPGQEKDKRPSRQYMEIMLLCIDAVAVREAKSQHRNLTGGLP